MSLRILVITPWFPNKPGEQHGNFILHSVEALLRARNQVTVLVTRPWVPRIFGLLHPDWVRPSLQPDKFDSRLNIHVTHFISIPRYYLSDFNGPLYRLGTLATIKKLIRQYDIQLIHAHTEYAAHAAIPAAIELGIPSAISIHGIDTSPRLLNTARKRACLRSNLNQASRVILVGEPVRGYFSEITGRDDHFRVVPNGFFVPEQLNIAGKKFDNEITRIISVSNLLEGKGIDITLQALHLLLKEGYGEWTYTVVGGGAEMESLKNMTVNLGLETRVSFTGALSHHQALEALGEADIFLLPSYREAFGVAYLEAMASGLLTIGVQGQGPDAFISSGETGYLVPPRDAEAIQRLLKTVMNNKAAATLVATEGQKHVRANFSWEHHAEKLTEVFGEVVAGDRN